MSINGNKLYQMHDGVLSAATTIEFLDSNGMPIGGIRKCASPWQEFIDSFGDIPTIIALVTFGLKYLHKKLKPVPPAPSHCRQMLREMIPALRHDVQTLSWLPADSNTKEIRARRILGPAEVMARWQEWKETKGPNIIHPYAPENVAQFEVRPEDVFTFKTLEAIKNLHAAFKGAPGPLSSSQSFRNFKPSLSVLDSKVVGSHILAGHPGSNRMSGLITGYKRTGDGERENERQFVGVEGLNPQVRFILDSKEDSRVGSHTYSKGVNNNWGLRINDLTTVMADRDERGALRTDLLVISLFPNYLHKDSFEAKDTILLIEGAHGVGTEASSLLWRNERLVGELYGAWKQSREPRYWQAVFEATNITRKLNPKLEWEPAATALDFVKLYKVTPDEQKLVEYGEQLRARFAERMADLQPL